MPNPEISLDQLSQTQHALAQFFADQLTVDVDARSDKFMAGAILLTLCAGIAIEQTPAESRPSLQAEVARSLEQVGLPDERARQCADFITSRRVSRYCGTGHSARYIKRLDTSHGYQPQQFLDGLPEFFEED